MKTAPNKPAAKCPVCDYDIDASRKPINVGGKVVLVCCDECEQKVRANPDKYLKAK